MKRLTLLPILLGLGLVHSAQALEFHPTQSITLDWAEPGIFQFDSFTIPAGVTVSLPGVNADLAAPTAYFNIAGDALLEGTLLAPGWNVTMNFYGNFVSTSSSRIEAYSITLNGIAGTPIDPTTSVTPGATLILSSSEVPRGPNAEIILGPIGGIALVPGGDISLVNMGSTTLSAPIPEPKTYLMLLAGLGLIGFVVRKRG